MSNSVQEILTKTAEFFKSKKVDSPRLEAEILLSEALKWDRIQLYLKFDQPLSEGELDLARGWVRRRAQGEPLAYILGKKFFFRSSFKVNSSVLIPRPETETIVEYSVEKCSSKKQESLKILDLGSGTGCIGLSLLRELPNAECTFVDLSAEALAVAKENAESLALTERSHWVNGEYGYSAEVEAKVQAQGPFDIIVSNPPYLEPGDSRIENSVLQFEPHVALFAKDKGFDLIERWAALAEPMLSPRGFVVFEIGLDHGQRAVQHLSQVGFSEVSLLKDLSGVERFVTGFKK